MIDDRPSVSVLAGLLEVGEDDEAEVCVRCHQKCYVPPELEPTSMCNSCAQWFMSDVGPLLIDIVSAAMAVQETREEYLTNHDVTCLRLGQSHATLDAAISKVRR